MVKAVPQGKESSRDEIVELQGFFNSCYPSVAKIDPAEARQFAYSPESGEGLSTGRGEPGNEETMYGSRELVSLEQPICSLGVCIGL